MQCRVCNHNRLVTDLDESRRICMECHYKMCSPNRKYIVEIEEDEDGNGILQFPDELIDTMGWKEGDDIFLKENADGTFALFKNGDYYATAKRSVLA